MVKCRQDTDRLHCSRGGIHLPLLYCRLRTFARLISQVQRAGQVTAENQFCGNGSSFAVFPSITLNTTYRGCSWPLGKKVASPNTVPFIVLPRIASATVLRSRVFVASTARAQT